MMKTDLGGQHMNQIMTSGTETPNPSPKSGLTRAGNCGTATDDAPNPSSPALSTTSTSSGKNEPPKRLRYWLIDMINSGTIPGLQWEDPSHTIFRIPWKHAGKNNWKEEDCRIFKAWAEHRGKFKKGDKIDAATWKTRLRCALNKLPDIKELKDRSHLDGNDPYRVYQLLPEPDKTTEFEIYPRNTWGRESSPPHTANNNMHPYAFGYPQQHAVPFNGAAQNMQISHINLNTDPSKEFGRLQMQETVTNQDYYTINKLDLISPTEASNSVQKSMLTGPTFSQDSGYNASMDPRSPPLPGGVASPGGSEVSAGTLPTDLEFDSEQSEASTGDMRMFSPGMYDLQVPDKAPEPHEMDIYIRYRGITVMTEHITEQTGCRIHYGDTALQRIAKEAYDLPSIVFGPESLQQVGLVECDSYTVSAKQTAFTKHVLENMKRGLIINYEDGCFYAKRLCQSRVGCCHVISILQSFDFFHCLIFTD
ncbi:unnamed protein product [Clavelina lepadiformis]|uniref:IRF tryptophan pentad repeat domain-containing protein n=1 Tax=Clavelina lepadiformis TaxID=159417 RepID=A0ABP0FTQ7_CLALP